MTIDDMITTSARMVYRNRRRYKTVVIAIALGTVGFVLIRTLGQSVQGRVAGDLELIGEATVLTAWWEDRKTPHHLGEFLLRDAARLSELPHVVIVAPVRRTEKKLKVGRGQQQERGRTQLFSVDERFWFTQAAQLLRGRLIDADDVKLHRQVCVLGKEVANDLFGSEDPIEKKIYSHGYPYEVIGVFSGLSSDDIAESVFVPLSRGNVYLDHTRQYVEFYIRADNWDNVKAVRESTETMLRNSHPNYASALRVRYRSARLERVGLVMFTIKTFSYAALVAIFLLGKVGLTNVMLSAMQDRTREVGIRKAFGASDELIRAQFILESVFVSVTAGLIGVAGGIFSVYMLKGLLGIHVSNYVMLVSILLDLLVTTALGVAAGYYPSLQASRLDIVTAMRFE